MTITYKDLRAELRKQIWPAGEARSMRDAHDAFFQQAMNDLQTAVTCLQQNNGSVFRFCSTYFDCGMTVFQAPIGMLKRLFTIANDDWCDRVIYKRTDMDRLRCWTNRMGKVTVPLNVGRATLPSGFKFAESSTDSVCGRARIGVWALHNGRIYVAPWIQSNEKVVVEWDGPRPKWDVADVVDEEIWGPAEQNAIKMFVLWQHEIYFGDPGRAATLEATYATQLADAIWRCRERERIPDQPGCADQREPTSDEILDDQVPDADQYVVGVVGDYGQDGTPEADVAQLITGLGAKIVITTGDNTYSADLANNILKHYTAFIDKTDATKTKFWPCWGNHDWDQNNLQDLLDYFTLLGNERYYALVYGPIHFFFLDSDPREPDLEYVDATTTRQNSIMGKWLQAMAAISTADWKVVVFHHAPKSSDSLHGSSLWMDWDFASMGIDLVLSGHGHNYERVLSGSLNYIVNGIGGASLRGFGAPVAGSQVRFSSDYGGQIITATPTQLKSTAYDRIGNAIDTLTLTK